MSRCKFHVSLYAVVVAVLLAGCGSVAAPISPKAAPTIEAMPPSPPPSALGEASGKLQRKVYPAPGKHYEMIDFTAKFVYAYPEIKDGQKLLWLVVSDQAPDTGVLDAAEDRGGALERWCHDRHAPYLARAIDAKGSVIGALNCDGVGYESRNFYSGGANAGQVTFALNDGKRLEGQMHIEHFATGDYRFAADVAPPSLRDRVLTTGKEDASGVPGAKEAYLDYFRAYESAKTLTDLNAWYTPEERSRIKPGDPALTINHDFAMVPRITSAKALGAVAVIDSEFVHGTHKLVCQTLMLQLEGKWKRGRGDCVPW